MLYGQFHLLSSPFLIPFCVSLHSFFKDYELFYVLPFSSFTLQILTFILSHPSFRELYFIGNKQYITTLCRLYFPLSTDHAYEWMITAIVTNMSLLRGYIQYGCIVMKIIGNEQ